MEHNNLLAIFFALASALTIAWGTVARHQIAEQTSGDSQNRSGVPILQAITRPLWWAGVLCSMIGYALQIIALGFGTLLVVQPILVLSLMFTLPLSARYEGRRVSRSEMFWAGLLTVAVTILVLMGRPIPGQEYPSGAKWLLYFGLGLAAMVPLYLYAGSRPFHEKALFLGLITGSIMGYLAVLSKAVVDILAQGGIINVIESWELYALVFLAVLGTAVQQASFNAGALKNSLPAMTIAEPIVAFCLGYLLLGESFQVHGYQWGILMCALLIMIFSTVVLSRKGID